MARGTARGTAKGIAGGEATTLLVSGATVARPDSPPNPTRVEWPTIAVIVVFAVLFGAVIKFGARWPLPVTVVSLAVLGGWWGSIQHEATHGHPTPWPSLNLVLTNAPLGLVYPFWLYRDQHLIHHRDENLTDPDLDPESRYERPGDWAAARPAYQAMREINQTLVGRMAIGPALVAADVSRHLIRLVRAGRNRLGVARWMLAVAVILVTVNSLGLAAWTYALGFGYGGLSVTLIRSFAEHRAGAPGQRTAIVNGGRFWNLLFLNVNLHVTHHRQPHLAWYRIPAARSLEDDAAAAAGAGLYRSYLVLIARYAFGRIDQVAHPNR